MQSNPHILGGAVTREQLMELVEPAMTSTRAFAELFMPQRFTRRFVGAHDDFFGLLDDDTKRRVAIAAPRGWGKTTIDSIALPARKTLFLENKFIVMLSATHGMAAQNVKNLARELTGNTDILRVFGNVKGPIWSEGEGRLETSTGVTILAKGAGQQIRGLLEGSSRPDLIIVDDLEDSEAYRLGTWEEYLRKLTSWFMSDLMGAIDRRRTRVVVVGTILAENSLLNQLLVSPDWIGPRIELCDDAYRSNFPDYMTDEEVAELAAQHARMGLIDDFFREYRNIPISPEDALFKRDYFKYYPKDDHQLLIDNFNISRAVIVDPAKTTKHTSAYSAIVGVGFDAIKNRIYVFDVVNERLEPDQIYQKAYEMAVRLRTSTIACEVTSLSDFITYPFNTYLMAKGFPPILELQAHGRKPDRIRQLAPFYRMGAVFHNPEPRIHNPIESQLLGFDRSKYMDAIDALAYMLKLFALGERHFTLSENEDELALEDELAMLDALDESAEALSHEWRIAP